MTRGTVPWPKLLSVENKGDLDQEAVWLDVDDDTDIGRYALCDTTYVDEIAAAILSLGVRKQG
jgi:hypothetical protein